MLKSDGSIVKRALFIDGVVYAEKEPHEKFIVEKYIVDRFCSLELFEFLIIFHSLSLEWMELAINARHFVILNVSKTNHAIKY